MQTINSKIGKYPGGQKFLLAFEQVIEDVFGTNVIHETRTVKIDRETFDFSVILKLKDFFIENDFDTHLIRNPYYFLHFKIFLSSKGVVRHWVIVDKGFFRTLYLHEEYICKYAHSHSKFRTNGYAGFCLGNTYCGSTIGEYFTVQNSMEDTKDPLYNWMLNLLAILTRENEEDVYQHLHTVSSGQPSDRIYEMSSNDLKIKLVEFITKFSDYIFVNQRSFLPEFFVDPPPTERLIEEGFENFISVNLGNGKEIFYDVYKNRADDQTNNDFNSLEWNKEPKEIIGDFRVFPNGKHYAVKAIKTPVQDLSIYSLDDFTLNKEFLLYIERQLNQKLLINKFFYEKREKEIAEHNSASVTA